MFLTRSVARRLVAVLVVLAAGRAAALQGQSATVPELKAAFIYNFAKFTEWPLDALPKGAPLVLCVVDDPHTEKALRNVADGKMVQGHQVWVRRAFVDNSLASCHLVFVDEGKEAGEVLQRLRDRPVLTVSDDEKFADAGGTAHLFVEQGRMRFAVNLQSVQRSRLRLSSRLLTLAKIIKDKTNAPRP